MIMACWKATGRVITAVARHRPNGREVCSFCRITGAPKSRSSSDSAGSSPASSPPVGSNPPSVDYNHRPVIMKPLFFFLKKK